jgi:hypothetical protein
MFMNKAPQYTQYEIGDWTYGAPKNIEQFVLKYK